MPVNTSLPGTAFETTLGAYAACGGAQIAYNEGTFCDLDGFCCSVAWDQICADVAIGSCTVSPVELQNFEVDR